jgi:hypothetical protein
MLDTRTAQRSRPRKLRRWSLREALDASSIADGAPEPPRIVAPDPPPTAEDEQMPAIVVKAQEDARCKRALARVGYVRARVQYARHRWQGKPIFESLEADFLWPTMEFVHAWLKEERKRIVARTRFPFLMTMLATIVAGLAFLSVAAVLG